MFLRTSPKPGRGRQDQRDAVRLHLRGQGDQIGDQPAHLLVARHVASLLPPGVAAPSHDWFRSVVQTPGVHRRILPSSDSPPGALEIVLSDAGDGDLYALITLRDAADAMADPGWRAGERMETLVNTSGALTHRSNNILTGMQSHAELLADQEDLPAEARTSANGILAAVANWKRLTARMDRVAAGLRPRPGQCYPALLLADLAERLRRTLPRGVMLTVDAPAGHGLLLTDAKGLDRALEELVANSVQAMGAKGHLRLRLRGHPAPTWPGFEWTALSVADDGLGIGQAAIEALEGASPAFQQSGQTVTLGLLISQAFAQGLGGSLHVERLPLVGTQVTLRLPTLRQRDEPRQLAPQAALFCDTGRKTYQNDIRDVIITNS